MPLFVLSRARWPHRAPGLTRPCRRIRAALRKAARAADETSYLRSLSTAIDQGARWLELCAARGFANYLAAPGRPAEARDILAPVVAVITEGQETLDYVYADALLKTL